VGRGSGRWGRSARAEARDEGGDGFDRIRQDCGWAPTCRIAPSSRSAAPPPPTHSHSPPPPRRSPPPPPPPPRRRLLPPLQKQPPLQKRTRVAPRLRPPAAPAWPRGPPPPSPFGRVCSLAFLGGAHPPLGGKRQPPPAVSQPPRKAAALPRQRREGPGRGQIPRGSRGGQWRRRRRIPGGAQGRRAVLAAWRGIVGRWDGPEGQGRGVGGVSSESGGGECRVSLERGGYVGRREGCQSAWGGICKEMGRPCGERKRGEGSVQIAW
jgi:hypothetical protein